jgi:DNA-binding MarR family transcriptional regulator
LIAVNHAPGALRQEIRQHRPFRSREQEGVVALFRTVDLLRRSLAGVVEERGITLQQYNVLRILRGAGDEGLPTLDIAARMIEHAPGVTRLLGRLEARGLVRRKRCPRDRRQVLCFATTAALRLLGDLDAPMDRADRQVLGMLDVDQLATLVGLLDRVRAAAEPSKASERRSGEREHALIGAGRRRPAGP